MKKGSCLVVVFCLATALVSAQEVKIGNGTLEFSGKVASGVFFDADDAIKESLTHVRINNNWIGEEGRVRMWNESDGNYALRGELSAAYFNENIGGKIRLRSDVALSGLDRSAIVRYAYGWVNLFNEGIKFTGGYIDLSDNVWGTQGDGDWDIGGNGVRLEIKPMRFFNFNESLVGSLNIGVFFMIPVNENSNIGRDDQGQAVYRTLTAKRILGETAFGFRYVHPVFYMSAQLKLDSDIDGVDIFEGMGYQIGSAHKIWSSAADEMRLMFGAGVTVLPEILLSVEGNFEGLGNWEARGTADLRQTLSYSFENLTLPVLDRIILGIKAQEIIWGYNLRKHIDWPLDLNPWVQVKPFIKFRITPEFTAGLETGFGFGHFVMGSLIPPSSNNGDQNTKDRMFVNEKSNIYIKPVLTYNFKGGLALTAWYKATFIKYQDLGDDPMFADLRQLELSVPKKANNLDVVDSLFKTQVALEFIWTF